MKKFVQMLTWLSLALLVALVQAEGAPSAASEQLRSPRVTTAPVASSEDVQANNLPRNGGNQVDQWIAMSTQFDQRLLTTVFWALGLVATFAVGLAGFSWFSNYRAYERDKASIKEELRTGMSAISNALMQELAAAVQKESAAAMASLERRVAALGVAHQRVRLIRQARDDGERRAPFQQRSEL